VGLTVAALLLLALGIGPVLLVAVLIFGRVLHEAFADTRRADRGAGRFRRWRRRVFEERLPVGYSGGWWRGGPKGSLGPGRGMRH